MAIHTPELLEKQRRKQARIRRGVRQTLLYMEKGQALHRHLDQQGPRFMLSNGAFVSPEIAVAVINHPSVVARRLPVQGRTVADFPLCRFGAVVRRRDA